MSVDHYENFPVASWLCPPHLRPAIQAIYWFARTADDLADEGDAGPAQRAAELADYRQALERAARGDTAGRWAPVFGPLHQAMRRHALPLKALQDLLSAFEQDVHNPLYPDRDTLLDYCARSANPVGRLLLHLYGIDAPAALSESDAVCTALQLINFWQDLSVDLPRGRHYIPLADARRHGLTPAALAREAAQGRASAPFRALTAELTGWARDRMLAGSPLVHRIPGRAGWELRLVVQGGLRILDKIAAQGHDTLARRPALGVADAPRLLWRAWTMAPAPMPAGRPA
ncbi:squalene synthase HpnC [Aquincola sp. MAHUQ-54]|uniref:Squalene synthase HpnC n=1 Tax=Aquincola agrisoli TaxID=3119538 RepID=A0AAW9QFD0_9BURK